MNTGFSGLKEQLWWAEIILEAWSHGQSCEYSDFMVTPEVESVRDLGDAINAGTADLFPVARAVVPGKPLIPFIATEEKLRQTERLDKALENLRARKAALGI